MHYGQTTWQWLGLFLTILVVALVSGLVQLIFRRLAKRAPSPRNRWLRLVSPILCIVFILVALIDRSVVNAPLPPPQFVASSLIYRLRRWLISHAAVNSFLDDDLNLTGFILNAVTTGGRAIAIILAASVVFNLCCALAETMIALPKISDKSVDASVLRLASSVIGSLLFMWIVISGLYNLGVNMIPLVAGLGVGGLAVALAARPTIENIIGSFMIFADKPYRVGQRVKVLGHEGTVESIGLRSTKIRLLTGHQTSIPNEKMASVEIENVGRRPHIRRDFNVTIAYDTPAEKINRALEILRDILAVPETLDLDTAGAQGGPARTEIPMEESEKGSHPNEAINQAEFPPRVAFNALNSDSLNLLVVYWYHPAEYWDYLEHATWINVQIMERFNSEGIDFAFPTQTLHLASDDKRPLTVGQRWESDETNFAPNAMVAQAAAFGAQSVLAQQAPASDAVRPDPKAKSEPDPIVERELTDAPIEDDIMQGDDDDGGEDGAER
jgi:MscS family membrane protein